MRSLGNFSHYNDNCMKGEWELLIYVERLTQINLTTMLPLSNLALSLFKHNTYVCVQTYEHILIIYREIGLWKDMNKLWYSKLMITLWLFSKKNWVLVSIFQKFIGKLNQRNVIFGAGKFEIHTYEHQNFHRNACHKIGRVQKNHTKWFYILI